MKRVAVIAVHGVGSPPPFSTARSLAELLIKKASRAAYSPFVERFITIPTAPLKTGEPRPPASRDRLARLRRLFRKIGEDRTEFANASEAARQPDIAFMREQLRDYKSDHAPYETIEIVGTRDVGPDATAVHLFEMHWADLSRAGDGLLRLVGAIYQLVLHVSHLGRKTVDIAAHVAAHRKDASGSNESSASREWTKYGTWHARSVRIFTTFVPVTTMVMMAFVPLFVPATVEVSRRLPVGVIAAMLLVIIGGGLGIYFKWPERSGAGVFVAFTFAVIAGGIWLITRVPDPNGAIGTALLTAVIALVVAGALWTLLGRYGKSRPGVRPYGIAIAVAVFAATWFERGLVLDHAGALHSAERVRLLAFVAVQLAWLVLVLTWAALWISVAIALWWRASVARRTTGNEHRRALRAIWTARVTLAVTIFGFIVFSLVAYQSAVFLGEKASNKQFRVFPDTLANGELPIVAKAIVAGPCDSACKSAALSSCDTVCKKGDPRRSAPALFTTMIARSGTSGFVLALAGCAVCLIMISWFIALVAVTALAAPDPVKNSRRLGLWMTQGFWWMRNAGSLLAYVLLVAILGGLVIDLGMNGALSVGPEWIRTLVRTESTGNVVNALTVAVLAGAVTFGTARLRIEVLASKTRPALGIMLDVDNYLRESPNEGTPRARIAERFVSLLRYVDREKFDAVVLVSHSQGTVITADLLRFLHAEQSTDAGLISPNRVHLMTMGSPLRQLYAANFPHLYEWVDASDDADTTANIDKPATDRAESIEGRSPDPASLNIGRWVNLYTTGDYVGRNLWHRDDWECVWDRQEFDKATAAGQRRERCLGAGTHTKYWTSGDVADELDALISGGVGGPTEPYLPSARGVIEA